MNTNIRRRQILNFIRSRLETEGQAPSLDEIAAASGLKSRSAAQKHVKALEASGELKMTPGKARSTRPRQRKVVGAGTSAPLFEISVQDVRALDDSDLRELVARLCKAALAEADLPPLPVTWGGDQRAPDGGIDVRVQLPADIAPTAWIHRAMTGFQVKATRMGPADIQREMCPSGLLRPSIQEIIRAKGSYIIATSDFVADEEYRRRRDAMRAAVVAEAAHEEADLDYYDARRLSDWTNQHPGVVAWVRTRVDRPLQGWHPYGQWCDTRGGKAQPFLPDEKLRLADPHDPERRFSLAEGLVHVRKLLRTGGSAVRLTGLSGVGKTRFAQALFESDAAPDALPTDLAVYTDTAHSPNPTPLAVLDELLASGRRAILVVDNCAPQLHNQLTARCKASRRVGLLTIEYDIREDLPNETNVFHLETGSSDLIEKVIGQQFPHISQVNVAKISDFADGNSRVAIALANTLDRNDSLAGLSDKELFDRLFWLGKEVENELMVAAQACALVYSFEVDDIDGELTQLAALTNESALSLYRRVADLENRGLAQRRGKWRAILPHAVANTLATRALKAIPYSLIERQLIRGQDRLLTSFSRRLGYLHGSREAVSIVRRWLSPGELLGDMARLTPLQADVFFNVAPVDIDATLKAIEYALESQDCAVLLSPENHARARIVRVVRSIAWEPKYFERCMAVLLAFALAEAPDNKSDATRSVIASLFALYLSGTHATTEQRSEWVKSMLLSQNSEIQSIGLACLTAALECYHFSSHHGFDFGAHKRDYGWSPQGRDAQAWFASFISLSVELGRGLGSLSMSVRDILASHFRSLWAVAGMFEELEAATITLLEYGWEKGWLAVRQTIRFDGEGLPAESRSKLVALEEQAKPTTVVGRVKAIVLSGFSSGIDYSDGEDASAGFERAGRLAHELGEIVAADADVFATVIPMVVRNQQGRQWQFGEGLAAGAEDVFICWASLVSTFESVTETERNVQVLRGFLSGVYKRDRNAFEEFLDTALERDSLAKWVPVLQLSVALDETGCFRLLRSMDNASVPAWVFQHLSLGRATESLSDDLLSQLLTRLSIKPDGPAVVIEVLSMHIFNNSHPVGPKVRHLAHELLAHVPLVKQNHHADHALGRLIEFFLQGSEGESTARDLLLSVREGFENYSLSKYDLTQTLAALFKVQPKMSLEILIGDDDGRESRIRRNALSGGRRSSALSAVPIDTVIEWCAGGPPERWTRVAPLLPAFESGADEADLRWSSEVIALLTETPRPIDVAASLVNLIEPMSWMGSRSEAIKRRLPLLDSLAKLIGPEHDVQIASWKKEIMKTIDRELRRELEEHRVRDERFE